MKKMNKRKISLILIGVFILVTIGLLASKVTLSYLGPKVDEDKRTQGDIGANGNRLIFTKGTDITINANVTNFGTGKGNLTKSTTSSVEMIPADKTKAASEQYMALINIPTNTFKYTTSDKKPEVILTIKDENNQIINSIEGLTYVTAGDVSGFDITEKKGGFTINDAKEISTAAKETSKKHNWQYTVTLINLGTDQSENGNAELIVEGVLKKIPEMMVTVNNLPAAYGALANLNCNGATSTYNEKYQRVEITQINDYKTTCDLSYEQRTTKTYLNNYIIGLSGTTQGTGQVVNENGYRYEGKNPNNYIWFNNELWRIIGVFDKNSHGQNGQNLVKIMRSESLGALALDKSDINNWKTSSLKSLLNGSYFNQEDGTDSGYCYRSYYGGTLKSNCNYSKKGIKKSYRTMIKNATWYLGASDKINVTSQDMYGYERGTIVYNGNPTTDTGYIGLMYPSDYGYSALANSCSRSTLLDKYNSSICATQSWMYGKGYEWTLTSNTSIPNLGFCLSNNGTLNNYCSAGSDYEIRPVLYLDAGVYKIDGNGSINNPYIIGM